MPAGMQAALLRVLETSEVRPVGSSKIRRVDVRLVAASHRDLAHLVEQGSFRADLRYRLEVVRIEVPPLRDRLEDIPDLSAHLLREVSLSYRIPQRRLSVRALDALCLRPWPGNVRELRNVLAGAALAAEGDVIEGSDLPPDRSAPPVAIGTQPVASGLESRPVPLESIRRALKATAGRRSRAAQLLGISRSTFYRYLETYDIDPETEALGLVSVCPGTVPHTS